MILSAAQILLTNLIKKINILAHSKELTHLESIIRHIKTGLQDLKALVNEHGFKSEEEEVTFNKEIAVEYYALLFYYCSLYKIQCRLQPLSPKLKNKYLQKELRRIDEFFLEHMEFYRYYRTKSTDQDKNFFMHYGTVEVEFNDFSPLMDNYITTINSLKVAAIKAYEKLTDYIHECLGIQDNTRLNAQQNFPALRWTASKIGLVEYIYAFFAAGVFNDGNVTLEAITKNFEKTFLVDLGTITVARQEILRRKKGATTFQDWVKHEYLRYSDEIEEQRIGKNRQK
ncbi:RteC domain-containing protein [Chitinophaga sp. sic0106]|uniref:RteC domain-containing protein n=1 Tax=Chitinophaga sp. sic0106 TaxID=2854785 RepID=UPI001C487047|nr:RteC domain-containing protein [Chitinophaga sp. sic0106]MBV7530999.1 RteC domain-containing protein [Chitinophaga sp. sic0106]